jgi:hypothetical protein
MKKLSLLLLVGLLVCSFASGAFATVDATVVTSFAGSSSAVSTVIYPINADYALRAGLGLSIPDGASKTYVTKLGVNIKPLMGINIDLDTAGNMGDFGKAYTLSVSKAYLVNVNDNLKMGWLATLFTYDNNSNIKLLSAITPVICADLTLF